MNREDYLLQHTKQDPEKHCAYCGKEMHRVRFASGRLEDIGAFMRRKYCDRECMKRAFVKIGKNNRSYSSAHTTARHIAYLLEGKDKKCEICGSEINVDVHHKDGDYTNNVPENIQLLCRSCHLKEHNPKGICIICGLPAKGHGLCEKHLIRLRKYGDPEHIPWSQYKEKASKGPVLQYAQDGSLVATYKDLRTAERETKYARSSIASACNGNKKTLDGYIWRYGNKD